MFAGGVIFAEIIKICPVANGDRSVYKLTYIRYAVLKAHVHTSGRDRKQTACGFESLDSVNVPLNYFCTYSEKVPSRSVRIRMFERSFMIVLWYIPL